MDTIGQEEGLLSMQLQQKQVEAGGERRAWGLWSNESQSQISNSQLNDTISFGSMDPGDSLSGAGSLSNGSYLGSSPPFMDPVWSSPHVTQDNTSQTSWNFSGSNDATNSNAMSSGLDFSAQGRGFMSSANDPTSGSSSAANFSSLHHSRSSPVLLPDQGAPARLGNPVSSSVMQSLHENGELLMAQQQSVPVHVPVSHHQASALPTSASSRRPLPHFPHSLPEYGHGLLHSDAHNAGLAADPFSISSLDDIEDGHQVGRTNGQDSVLLRQQQPQALLSRGVSPLDGRFYRFGTARGPAMASQQQQSLGSLGLVHRVNSTSALSGRILESSLYQDQVFSGEGEADQSNFQSNGSLPTSTQQQQLRQLQQLQELQDRLQLLQMEQQLEGQAPRPNRPHSFSSPSQSPSYLLQQQQQQQQHQQQQQQLLLLQQQHRQQRLLLQQQQQRQQQPMSIGNHLGGQSIPARFQNRHNVGGRPDLGGSPGGHTHAAFSDPVLPHGTYSLLSEDAALSSSPDQLPPSLDGSFGAGVYNGTGSYGTAGSYIAGLDGHNAGLGMNSDALGGIPIRSSSFAARGSGDGLGFRMEGEGGRLGGSDMHSGFGSLSGGGPPFGPSSLPGMLSQSVGRSGMSQHLMLHGGEPMVGGAATGGFDRYRLSLVAGGAGGQRAGQLFPGQQDHPSLAFDGLVSPRLCAPRQQHQRPGGAGSYGHQAAGVNGERGMGVGGGSRTDVRDSFLRSASFSASSGNLASVAEFGPGPGEGGGSIRAGPNQQRGGGGGRLRGEHDPRRLQFVLDLDRIQNGEDSRTTLMVKNIPNKYTQKMLLATIDEKFRGMYDFFYLPIDFKNKCNVGYAFINMMTPLQIVPFFHAFNGKKWDKFNSEKVASIAYARIQGKPALVSHFQNSSLMNEDKRCRPILFHSNGPNAGDQEPFPSGIPSRSRNGSSRDLKAAGGEAGGGGGTTAGDVAGGKKKGGEGGSSSSSSSSSGSRGAVFSSDQTSSPVDSDSSSREGSLRGGTAYADAVLAAAAAAAAAGESSAHQ